MKHLDKMLIEGTYAQVRKEFIELKNRNIARCIFWGCVGFLAGLITFYFQIHGNK